MSVSGWLEDTDAAHWLFAHISLLSMSSISHFELFITVMLLRFVSEAPIAHLPTLETRIPPLKVSSFSLLRNFQFFLIRFRGVIDLLID